MGGNPIGFRALERIGRLWKSWRSETTAGKEEALHARIDKLHHELDDLKKEGSRVGGPLQPTKTIDGVAAVQRDDGKEIE